MLLELRHQTVNCELKVMLFGCSLARDIILAPARTSRGWSYPKSRPPLFATMTSARSTGTKSGNTRRTSRSCPILGLASSRNDETERLEIGFRARYPAKPVGGCIALEQKCINYDTRVSFRRCSRWRCASPRVTSRHRHMSGRISGSETEWHPGSGLLDGFTIAQAMPRGSGLGSPWRRDDDHASADSAEVAKIRGIDAGTVYWAMMCSIRMESGYYLCAVVVGS